ncbi:hypothetical protein DFH09DRAFT_1067601 [Mycena vulgaris]|nr:hypothetical protein DFH09DRAFT_1067601 [Mycena vulgaris]
MATQRGHSDRDRCSPTSIYSSGFLSFIRWLEVSHPVMPTLKSVALHATDNLWKSGTIEYFLRRAGGELESLSLWCPFEQAALVPDIVSVLPLCKWDTISIVLGIPEYRDSITWAVLDEALAHPRFHTLRRFRYSIKTPTDVMSLIEPETKLLLPLSNARGILE